MHSASARRPCRLSQRSLPRSAEASAFSTATYIQETFHARRKRPKAMPPSATQSPLNDRSIRVQHGGIYTGDVPCAAQVPEGHAAFHSAVPPSSGRSILSRSAFSTAAYPHGRLPRVASVSRHKAVFNRPMRAAGRTWQFAHGRRENTAPRPSCSAPLR